MVLFSPCTVHLHPGLPESICQQGKLLEPRTSPDFPEPPRKRSVRDLLTDPEPQRRRVVKHFVIQMLHTLLLTRSQTRFVTHQRPNQIL